MKTICKGGTCWFILVLIILTSFFAGKACGQDLTSWDLHTQAITDNSGYIVFKKTEPNGNGVAYVVYFLMKETNKLSVIHLKQSGNCFIGNPSVKGGQSFVLFYGVPCRNFDIFDTVYRKMIPPKPLEALDEG